jgi:HD-like signal output (HDOD) protein
MGLLRSILNKKHANKQVSDLDEDIEVSDTKEISIEILKQLIPIRNLNEEMLQSFSLGKKPDTLLAGETLFSVNEIADSAIYLLKGTVTLSDSNNKSYDVEATEAKARFPLSSGVKHATTAIAQTDISFLRVSQKIMSLNSAKHQSFELVIPEELKQCRVLQSFAQYFLDDELDIPSLPIIAVKLGEAMKKDIGIGEAVKIVQLDPVIAAKLIEVANCPLYISATPTKSCLEAIKKIGLNATRSLVISLSIKNIFKGASPKIEKHLDSLWKDSLYLSSLSYVLASVTKHPHPEEALLAGLVCDIGAIPFLNFVSNLPADYYTEEDIINSIPVVKGIVGASILKKWGFDAEIIEVPLLSYVWHQHTADASLTYTDIVVLSRLHHKIGRKETSDLPAITSIPAASKLKDMTLSPENSLSILHDAKDKINDALRTFSA